MSDKRTLSTDLFPDLIISEILTRLPAKSVCRFKSVSKRWKSIICNHRFILSYISRASSSSSWVILNRIPQLADESTQHATQLTLVDRPKVSTFTVNPHKLVADPARTKCPTVILQSSHGLFLLSVLINRDPHKEHAKDPNNFSWEFKEPTLFVVNPITREWVPLPKTRQPINQLTQVALTTRVDPGTGVVDKFLVAEYKPIIGSEYAQLICFSSDIGKWVEKPSNYMLGGHMWRADWSFEFEGRFFWVDLSAGLITWDAVDLESDKVKAKAAACRFIGLPEGRFKAFNTPELQNERCISTGGGVIQYLEVFKEGKYVVKLWSLDSRSGLWSFKHKVSRSNLSKQLLSNSKAKNVMPKPCFVHPYESDVAYFQTGDYIFSLNVKTQQLVSCGSFPGTHKYVIPFVIPRWPTPLPPRLCAAIAKEQGNEQFKKQKFVEAIKYYSKSIDLSPSAAAYANRAMAYLKVQSYSEAENDCSEALKLDDKYLKVYARRAKARKELGNLEGSMHDVEFALKLEPGNREVKNQYAELKALLEKASVAESVDSYGGPAGDMHMELESKECTVW